MATAAQEVEHDFTDLPEVMNKKFGPLLWDRKRNLVLMGGAGSGKSVFISQKIALRLMEESDHHFGAFRKVARTCLTSVFAEMKRTLEVLGVREFWKENVSNLTLTYLPNGSVFRCFGLDDVEKLKSIYRLTGAWLEEATEMSPDDYTQINLRIRGLTPFYKQIIFSFNPISRLHWLKARFFDREYPNTTTHVSTFKDNRFLDLEYIKELEGLADLDKTLHGIYALGKWGLLKGLIYTDITMREWDDIQKWDSTFFGLDFGYNSPMALMRIDERDGEFYLTEELYETRLTTGQFIERMKDIGIPKNKPIYCDAAEPDRIQEIGQAGYDVYPWEVVKPKRTMIVFCKGLTLFTKSANVNLNAEKETYKWREDRTGAILDEPVDYQDHALDATGGALFTHLRGREQFRISASYAEKGV